MIKKFMIRLLIISLNILSVSFLYAGEPASVRLSVKYTKLTNGLKRVEMSLVSFDANNKRSPVENARLSISCLRDTSKDVLGFVATDWKGKAAYEIPQGKALPKATDGTSTFQIDYEGSSAYAKASGSITVKDITLDIQLDEADTNRAITAIAAEINEKGEKVLVKDQEVEFDIVRLFCLYPIGTAKTDSTGKCSVIFPKKFPGDLEGMVTLVARFVDNETYGNVEKRLPVKWGMVLVPEVKPKRGLGDTDAPLWMVYTLFVLLSGVWFHFMYIVYLVVKINIIGKKSVKPNLQV